ncbi:MAG: hydrogenase maturation protease [Chlamydiae bacterium]|nr:hydrogenase maturation protease [Chlamydiota bacterium]
MRSAPITSIRASFKQEHTVMDELIIIGIGNPFRGDDRAGWVAIERLAEQNEKLPLNKTRGDVGELVDKLGSHKKVIIIDACRSEDPAGTWKKIDAIKDQMPSEAPVTSTHGATLSQVIEMAKNLDRMPEELTIFAISGKDYDLDESLTNDVDKAISAVIQEILKDKDVQACMNKA